MRFSFRQAMAPVHTWSGLLVGWVLFFVFLTGTAGYFDSEIDRWMQPERPLTQATVPPKSAVAVAQAMLERTAPDAKRWFVQLPDDRSPDVFVFWLNPRPANNGASATGSDFLDAATGASIRHRDTGGGQFLYRMHYDLHYLPNLAANWIVGLCAMAMLIAIVTGVVIHKRVFRDFFTFRPRKGQRSWLDLHNVLGVTALPFHVMITYSGLVFFAYIYMAPVITASYGAEEDAHARYFDELSGRASMPDRSGVSVPLIALAPLVKSTQAEWGTGGLRVLEIHNPGDANARIVLSGGVRTPTQARRVLTFDGTTGELLDESVPRAAPIVVWRTLLGLHEGLFAGPVLRWLYFISGLIGTAMIGTGLIVWTAKRRQKSAGTIGFRLVEGLNVGTIVGLPVAIAGYFWANRLIPVGVDNRAAWEAHSLFLVWTILLSHAFLRPGGRAWTEQLWLAAAAFGLLPAVNALTTDKHLGNTVPAGVWDLAGVDLTMLTFGVAFAIAAWRSRSLRSSRR